MRRRLILLAAANTIMVALAFLVPLAVLVLTLARDRALSAAELEAQSLAPALALTTEPDALQSAVRATSAGADGRLALFLGSREVVGDESARRRLDPDSLDLARRGRAFSVGIDGGRAVLVPVVLAGESTAVVAVFVPDDLLMRGVRSAWAAEVGIGVVLVVVAVTAADRMARSIVRPVQALAGAATRLGEGDLSVRIEPEGPPEIAQAAAAFNRLGNRVGQLLMAERELVADLSHRLRTPLTALRLEVEALPDRADAARLGESVDEVEAAVDGVIRQARRPVHSEMGPSTDACTVARDRVAFWAALAEDQDRPWALDVRVAQAEVAVTRDELEAALDVLIGNVFAHTSEGTALRVEVTRLPDGGTRLSVDDDGPGFSGDLVARGASGAGSTGLGLDIARRAAEAAGGHLRIGRTASGGASVALEFRPVGPVTDL